MIMIVYTPIGQTHYYLISVEPWWDILQKKSVAFTSTNKHV